MAAINSILKRTKGVAFNMKSSGVEALNSLINQVVTYRSSITHSKYDKDVNFDLWSILSALRGPDGGSEGLKDKYTGPIRAWISQEWNNNIGSTTRSNVLTLSEFRDLRNMVWNEQDDSITNGMNEKAFDHYTGHIMQALDAIIRIERFKELKIEKAFTDELAKDR